MKTSLLAGRVEHVRVRRGSTWLTWGEVIRLWRTSSEFAQWFSGLLAEAPFEALFWETPPLTKGRLGDAFEYVAVNSPELAGVEADPRAFASFFDPALDVVEFGNLGGDAHLIVPCPGGQEQDFAHLAAFVRCASGSQMHALWGRLAEAIEKRLSTRPVWCSTSGLGVYWLHLRIDSRPKYYTYQPYRLAGG